MPPKSAGILLFRKSSRSTEVFLVHPGGPFWAKKDLQAWSLPKGEFHEQEDPLEAARREFFEETGMNPEGNFLELTPVRMKSGKWLYAWALEGEINPAEIRSNTFEIEWPPHSGKKQSFPEVDKGAWFDLRLAKEKISPSQLPFLQEFAEKYG